MFLGQIALAFAAKRTAPKCSLGVLILAALLPDLLWTILVVAGVERVRFGEGGTIMTPFDFVSWPISHSLLLVLCWALVAAAIHQAWTGYGPGSRAIFALVGGHWLLDALSHGPDLPVVPGFGLKLGLGLGNIPYATIPFEAALFFVGLALYLDATRPIRSVGRFGLVGMIGFAFCLFAAVAVQIAPEGFRFLIATSVATWMLVPWGAWVDRYRVVPRAA